jgi:hypothetical protein
MSWLSAMQIRLNWPLRGDRRSEPQIEDDLEDEFAFHLEQRARALIEEGNDPAASRGLARARFGDVERIKRQCKRIAMEERIMLQRVNVVMMGVVMLMVIGVGLHVMITQRYNTLALQAITTDLARMKFESAAEARVIPIDHAGADNQTAAARVLVEGDVDRPGWYPIDMNDLTYVRDLLEQQNVKTDQWVRHQRSAASSNDVGAVPVDYYINGGGRDTIVRPSDEVRIMNDASPNARRHFFRLTG